MKTVNNRLRTSSGLITIENNTQEEKNEKSGRTLNRRPKAYFYQKEKKMIAGMAIFDAVLLLLAYFFMLNVRITEPTPAWIIRNASVRMADLFNLLSGRPLQSGMNFFLFRLLMVMLAGAALAVAGAVYQAVFRNPLASPTILGVQTGGGLGAALFLLFFVSPVAPAVTYGADAEKKGLAESLISGNSMQYFMIVCCFLSLLIVILLSRAAGKGTISPLPMILCGTVFSSLCATIIAMLQSYFMISDAYATRIDALGSVMTGSFEQVYSLAHLLGMGIPIITGMLFLFRSAEKLNSLTLHPHEVRTTGMDVNRGSAFYLILATGITSVVVAFCGTFTFVGLVSPYLCRQLVGANHRYVLPASMFMGAALTMLAYWIAYAAGYTALVNISLSAIGGVVFAAMMIRRKGDNYV